MKVCSIVGRLTKDCRVQETEKGGFVSFSVAVDDGYGENKTTIFFDADYGKKGYGKLAQYLVKGKQVAVSGDLKTREYNGKTYLGIRANSVELVGSKPDRKDTGSSNYTEHDQPPASDMDDEIPF